MRKLRACEICKSKEITLIKKITKKNLRENLFGLEFKKNYQRNLYKCRCGHFYNIHKYSKFLDQVYKKSYSEYSHNDIKKNLIKSELLKKNHQIYKELNF